MAMRRTCRCRSRYAWGRMQTGPNFLKCCVHTQQALAKYRLSLRRSTRTASRSLALVLQARALRVHWPNAAGK